MEDLSPRPGDLEPIETASRDEIMGLQFQRMQWSLSHAYENSRFYKERFDKAGVHPSDLKTLTDLAKFPFTVKTDLRDTYPFGMFAVPREKLARLHAQLAQRLVKDAQGKWLPEAIEKLQAAVDHQRSAGGDDRDLDWQRHDDGLRPHRHDLRVVQGHARSRHDADHRIYLPLLRLPGR